MLTIPSSFAQRCSLLLSIYAEERECMKLEISNWPFTTKTVFDFYGIYSLQCNLNLKHLHHLKSKSLTCLMKYEQFTLPYN